MNYDTISGWAWHDVLPYFKKLEDDVDFGDAEFHGKGGPLPVGRVKRDILAS